MGFVVFYLGLIYLQGIGLYEFQWATYCLLLIVWLRDWLCIKH